MSLQRIPLQPIDGVTISILADNLFDGLLPDAFIQSSVGTRFEL